MSTHTSDPDPEPDGRRRPGRRRPPMGRPARGSGWSALRPSWWRDLLSRVAALFRPDPADDWPRPRDPLGLPDLLDAGEPQEIFTLETPAMGEAHNFVISARCSWCIQATAHREHRKRRTQEVERLIDKHRPVVRRRIEDTIRREARRFPPYRAAEAEEAISKVIGECLSEGEIQVKVQIRVDVCEPVREDLRKVWHQRLVEDTRLDLIGELQESWRELLLKGLGGIGEVQVAKSGWIAPYALALAQNPQENAAQYLSEMINHRVTHAEGLLAELSDLTVDPRVEAIEFAFGSDSALRAVLTHLGVPVPQRGSDLGNGSPAGDAHA